MPKSSKAKLAYQADYNNRPDQVKKQTLRKAAQRAAIKDGSSPIGDGKDVMHKKALANGGTNAEGNLKVGGVTENRSWRKGRKGYSVPNK
jgi:hypothetical protein